VSGLLGVNRLRQRILSIAVAAAVLLVFAGASQADEPGGAGGVDVRTRIAILPMVVNSVGEHGYLRSGLSDMLASRLGQNPRVAVLRLEDADQATTDPARAAAIGAEHAADFVVFGSFTQFGQGASLDVQCVEARALEEDEGPPARRVFIQSGTVGDIIPKLDETAQKIAMFATGPAPAAGPPAVAAGPLAGPAPPLSAPTQAPGPTLEEVEALRRRLEAIEQYLFGETSDDASGSEVSPDASQDFGLR
jgi:TolB-like protein